MTEEKRPEGARRRSIFSLIASEASSKKRRRRKIKICRYAKICSLSKLQIFCNILLPIGARYGARPSERSEDSSVSKRRTQKSPVFKRAIFGSGAIRPSGAASAAPCPSEARTVQTQSGGPKNRRFSKLVIFRSRTRVLQHLMPKNQSKLTKTARNGPLGPVLDGFWSIFDRF